MLDEQPLFLQTALITSNVDCEVANKFFTMNYVKFMFQIVIIRLHEQVMRLMRNVSYRRCKKMGRKRNGDQNS